MSKLVSIIMSVYDQDSSDFLRECIMSVDNQSYEDIELILIGDGISKVSLQDGIKDLVYEYSSFLKYFPQPTNNGLAHCMNLAINLANGDFLARMDADDLMSPHRIQSQVSFLTKHTDVDVVGSWITEFNILRNKQKIIKYPLSHEDMKLFFGRRNPVAHPSVMMRKEFFEKAGNYPLYTNTDEDTVLWLNAFSNGCRFANINESLTRMRVSDTFFERRSGISKAFSDFKNRLSVIITLKLSAINYVFAFMRFILQIIPSRKLRHFLYNNLR